MTNHEGYMRRCIELARNGAGNTAPNPMVGCVIVNEGRIIGEGYHAVYGGPHAEVNAVRSVRDPRLLSSSTMYVSLEPCSHHGKTPPCSDLILNKRIPHVIIGTSDPFSEVAGKGIARLRQGGVNVETGVLESECRWQNRRFFTFHESSRPYVILKWAQTLDGFIAPENVPGQPVWISGRLARTFVHKTRTEEGAILVGTETVIMDNPSLTARDWSGKSPLRVVIDRTGRIPFHYSVFNGEAPTLVFTGGTGNWPEGVDAVQIRFDRDVPLQILQELYRRDIQSVIIEGGAVTLQHFINAGLWDEAHIFSGPEMFSRGVRAPLISGIPAERVHLDETVLTLMVNPFNRYIP